MRNHGTRIIIYNLWEDDQGQLELDFDADHHVCVWCPALFVHFFFLSLLIVLFEHNSLSKILNIFVLCDLAGHSNQRCQPRWEKYTDGKRVSQL